MRNGVTNIKWFVVGHVPNTFVDRVLKTVRDFIEKVDGIEYLEIYFYASSYHKLLFIESEAIELGVIAVGDFIAMHEAWRGWPRIHIDYEKCYKLRDDHLKSVIVHEISHAILHGSPIYYSIALQAGDIPRLDSLEDVAKLLYVATTIAKDMDVHEFLIRSGMSDLVEGYADFVAEQYKGLDCRNIDDLLNLAKALTVCIYTPSCRLLKTVDEKCIDVADRVLRMLKEFEGSRAKSLSEDTRLLVKMLWNMVEGR
ncbi:MAG: hypothetical protein QW348_01820 [Ignisphaera sp.]